MLEALHSSPAGLACLTGHLCSQAKSWDPYQAAQQQREAPDLALCLQTEQQTACITLARK